MTRSILFPIFCFLLLCLTVEATNFDQYPIINPNSYKITIGDFNGDLKADYVLQKTGEWANQGGTALEVLLSQTNKTFQRYLLKDGFESRNNSFNLYVGDFNGDGYDDLLKQEKGGLFTNQTVAVYLLLSNGTGNFTKHKLPESFQLNGDYANIYIGDFDGDGKSDIFRQAKGMFTQIADINAWASWVLFSTGPPDFFRVVQLPLEYELNGDKTNLYVGDFNGDGVDDILRQEKNSFAADGVNTTNFLFSNLDGTFQTTPIPEDYNLNGDYTALEIADFNGDGIDDAIRREKGDWALDDIDTAQLLLSDGYGGFETISLPEDCNLKADSSNVYVGDFNGDGKADFLRQIIGEALNYGSKPNEIFLSTGESFERFEFVDSQGESKDAVESTFYVGDFDGNMKADLMTCVGVNVRIYYSNGDGSFI